jgi:phosphoribosylanthranilate isomerase
MLQGPNLELLTKVTAATESPIIASGGVRDVDDVRALVEMSSLGVEGVVIGKALYEGTLTIEEALEAANE